jgi:hypothetical protein
MLLLNVLYGRDLVDKSARSKSYDGQLQDVFQLADVLEENGTFLTNNACFKSIYI